MFPRHDSVEKEPERKNSLVGVYVDDLIITGSNNEDIVEFKEQMKEE